MFEITLNYTARNYHKFKQNHKNSTVYLDSCYGLDMMCSPLNFRGGYCEATGLYRVSLTDGLLD